MLSLGTDCSGMETPLMALRALGLKVDHKFSCDFDKNAKATIMANFPPQTFYDDIQTRNNKTTPAVSLYVAGFPCQPFSMAGLQKGFSDTKDGRGTVFWKVRDYIKTQAPTVFVLENVIGLKRIEGGKYFDDIMASLHALGNYNVSWQMLDTKEHGVPQTRQRIYIVGIKVNADKGTFRFPEPIPRPSIERFLDPRKGRPSKAQLPPRSQGTARSNVIKTLKKLEQAGERPFLDAWIVDHDSTYSRMSYKLECSPCITCRRKDGHWITNRGRRLNLAEMMRLQGMEPKGFKQVVSRGALGKQVGNAMSCNVLERVFCRVLPAAGLVPAGSLRDRWEAAKPASKRPLPKPASKPARMVKKKVLK